MNHKKVTLVRISNDKSLPEASRRNYKGVSDAFRRILKEEGWIFGFLLLFFFDSYILYNIAYKCVIYICLGVATFFSGSGPFVNRAMLVGAVQVTPFI